MVHLNDLPSNSIADSRLFIPAALPDAEERTALSFLGPIKPDDVNSAIARGEINPMTHQPFRVERVGEVVHVTSGDRNDAAQLPFVPAPRRTAPASFEPNLPHVGLFRQRKPSVGPSQPRMLPCIPNLPHMFVVLYAHGRWVFQCRCQYSGKLCRCVQAQVLPLPQGRQPRSDSGHRVAAAVHLPLCSAAQVHQTRLHGCSLTLWTFSRYLIAPSAPKRSAVRAPPLPLRRHRSLRRLPMVSTMHISTVAYSVIRLL